MSKIFNKQTGRMVNPRTRKGAEVIATQYGGQVPPTADSPKVAFVLEKAQSLGVEDELSISRAPVGGDDNIDSFLVVGTGKNKYDLCVAVKNPNDDGCIHEDVDFKMVTDFINDLDAEGELKGYNYILLNGDQIAHMKK